MDQPPNTPTTLFAPILSWDQIREALAHVTMPETKLALLPAIIADLKTTIDNPRTFALTLAVQIALLADPQYDIGYGEGSMT